MQNNPYKQANPAFAGKIKNSEWGLLSDKGKPAERQGRKAKGLRAKAYDRLVAEEQEFLLF